MNSGVTRKRRRPDGVEWDVTGTRRWTDSSEGPTDRPEGPQRKGQENMDELQPQQEGTATEADSGATGGTGAVVDGVREPSPGDLLRALPDEAQARGTRFVSANAMQARLFSVYDAAAAAEDALALVQQQLTLTLNRSYYEADEIESMATQLDTLLTLESLDLSEEGPAPHHDQSSEGDLVSEE
jgi:hypothetical protein